MNIPAQPKRRALRALLATALLGLAGLAPAHAAGDEVVMYKDPNCGCCGKWAEHMREHGFKVKEVATTQMDVVKREARVPQALGSCHTAKVGGYVVEGISGISAPGMPMGSPGMEGPYPADRYEVVSFDAEGRTAVFARH